MITEIRIRPRSYIEGILSGKNDPPVGPWYLLSIVSTPKEMLTTPSSLPIFQGKGLKRFINLVFADITRQQYEAHKAQFELRALRPFDSEHAEHTVNFLLAVEKENETGVLIVHCDAGVSRSGAVGTFASDFLKVPLLNPEPLPNQHVLQTLYRYAKLTPSVKLPPVTKTTSESLF